MNVIHGDGPRCGAVLVRWCGAAVQVRQHQRGGVVPVRCYGAAVPVRRSRAGLLVWCLCARLLPH